MDSILNAAALALAKGDLIGALNRVALREDAAALALRGIVMAQLGELGRARELLRKAALKFGKGESVAVARCVVAEAEIALVSRELSWPSERLEAARQVLEDRGDTANAAHARIIEARRHLLLGHLDLASQHLVVLDGAILTPAMFASAHLVLAGIDIRRLRPSAARGALKQAEAAAVRSTIAGLIAEVGAAQRSLDEPVALLRHRGLEGPISLEGVEALLLSDTLVFDATRSALRQRGNVIPLSTRPVLFALTRALAEVWPAAASREALLTRVFNARHADESHRTRLRVEVSRLRKIIRSLAAISATSSGYRLVPHKGNVAVLAVSLDDQHAMVLALLADGELWSSSGLSLVLGASTRTIQRALEQLQRADKILAVGGGRSRRWMALTLPGFPTTPVFLGGP